MINYFEIKHLEDTMSPSKGNLVHNLKAVDTIGNYSKYDCHKTLLGNE